MKEKCSSRFCSECGIKLGLFGGYHHSILGRDKCICGECWDKIEDSENQYSKFISNSLKGEGGGIICYVLISATPTFEKKLLKNLSNLPEIADLCPLLGRYDIIAKIVAKNHESLGSFIVNEIRSMEGIESTTTLTGAFSLVK